MGAKTEISWTDSTWSPLRARVKSDAGQIARDKGYTSLIQIADKMAGRVGHHCEHASAGCLHCYSETNNGRCLPANGTGLPFERRSRDLVDMFIDERILVQPLHWKKPRRIFVESQSDLFGEFAPDDLIDRVFAVMVLCPQHTWQILTKRAERMYRYVSFAHSRITALMEKAKNGQGSRIHPDGQLWRVGDRRDGEDLAFTKAPRERSQTRRRISIRIDEQSVQASEGRISGAGRIFTDIGDGSRRQNRDGSPQSCLGLLQQEANSAGDNDKPQAREREQNEQPSGQSGTRYVQSATETCARGVESTTSLSQRFDTSKDAPDGEGCDENQRTEGYRDGTDGTGKIVCCGVKGDLSHLHQENLEAHLTWPLFNVHLGVSCEDQQRANERIPWLLKTPAAVRWVSAEPLLGPIDLDGDETDAVHALGCGAGPDCGCGDRGIDWCVVGGESGAGARPMDITWARDIVAQCRAAAVPVFVKQFGAKPWDSTTSKVDHLFDPCGHACDCCDECPSNEGQREREEHPQIIKLKDRKGGDMSEWPEDLRVRQMPTVGRV